MPPLQQSAPTEPFTAFIEFVLTRPRLNKDNFGSLQRLDVNEFLNVFKLPAYFIPTLSKDMEKLLYGLHRHNLTRFNDLIRDLEGLYGVNLS